MVAGPNTLIKEPSWYPFEPTSVPVHGEAGLKPDFRKILEILKALKEVDSV